MTVTSKEAIRTEMTAEEIDALNKLEREVDGFILSNPKHLGDGTFFNIVDDRLREVITPRVVKEIIDIYGNIGWKMQYYTESDFEGFYIEPNKA